MTIEAQKLAVVITCDNCSQETTIYIPANRIDVETINDELYERGKWGWKTFLTKRRQLVYCGSWCKDMLSEKYAEEWI